MSVIVTCNEPKDIRELFARQKVEGWDCWGNEVGSDIDLQCLQNKQNER